MKRLILVPLVLLAGCAPPPDCPGMSGGDIVRLKGTEYTYMYRFVGITNRAEVTNLVSARSFTFACERLEKVQ
jgi:hypothetical protein